MKYNYEIHFKGTKKERYAQRYPNIDHERKIIFVHPPKCGGKSIEYCLFERKPIGASADHRLLCEYKPLLGENFDQFKSFFFCRNPYDRLVSTYYGRKQILNTNVENSITFKEWIMNQANPASWKYVTPPLHVKPGKYFAQRLQFDYVSLPHIDEVCVDFIGRFENYENDWKVFCHDILKEPIELPHLNKSKRKNYRKYYDDEMKKHVFKLWEKDLDVFKYTF